MFDYVETDLPKTRTRVDLSNRVIRHRRHIEVVPRTLSIRKSPIERYENLKLFLLLVRNVYELALRVHMSASESGQGSHEGDPFLRLEMESTQ